MTSPDSTASAGTGDDGATSSYDGDWVPTDASEFGYRVEEVLAGGARQVEADEGFDADIRRDLHQFLTQMARRAFLEDRGIVVNASVLREAVRRDIEALFNIERFESGLQLSDLEQVGYVTPQDIIADFPHVRRSVLNYGVPSFSGRSITDFDLAAL
ncbi:MAG: type VI secretion system baseplate subunit TssE, partial [Pseudomonadota bacterium]